MKILSNSGGIAQTNCFLIADEAAGKAVMFDAPDHTVLPLLQEAKSRKWDIIGLWLTHGHFDHIADHAIVTQHFPGAKVLMHRLDEPKLIHPKSRMFELPFVIPARKADAYVEDGEELEIGSIKVRMIFTPGHSSGHVAFYIAEHETLVGGDLIICGAVGRTDLPDSNPADLDASIRKVMQLPPATRLLPGHCQVSTLKEEAGNNPYVMEAMGRG